MKPNARIVLIMTRWHQDDLAGRLLAQQEVGGSRWRVLKLPAYAELGDPLGRLPGEALWPEWEGREALERKRAEIGDREWWSQFQQEPRPPEGVLFKVHMIQTMLAEPYDGRGDTVRAWDLAATVQTGSNDPSWTAGVKLRRLKDGRYIVLDVVRFRGGPEEVDQAIRYTAEHDGSLVRVGLPQDPGQGGKVRTLYLTKMLAGFRVEVSPESGSKELRAEPVAAQVNVGNFLMLQSAKWNASFLAELRDFPTGTYDDQVDALSRGFSMLIARPPMRISAEALARFN
jgi:predicted phage terminase large subunit-like protein